MRRRILTILLALCMVVPLFPVQVLAADVEVGSETGVDTPGQVSVTSAETGSALGFDDLGIREISNKKYAVTPDVTEYEWILNNKDLTQQMMGHVMEVKVGGDSTASIVSGYGDDNLESIKSGNNWAMAELTKQAQSMQTRREKNVVGAINAGGYDMSNGRPVGAFIMEGVMINRPAETTFWIDKDGAAHITGAAECIAAYNEGNVMQAVASFGDIFEDGHARAGLDNYTRASRTAIGIKADGTVVMFMVDGRQAPYSVGMTMAELAAAMESLGCVQAVNLDGGGSSTFATQREGEPENDDAAGLTLRCRPSDGYERKVSNTIMVLSTAKPTGEFDHAVLTPNDEVYTPGSTVQFVAKGVDSTGGEATVPETATWTVLSGGGTIDQNGLYTAADATGEVVVALKVGDTIVGKTSIQLQWPDKLGFTNTSVSLDFGETSDLTFKPTWQGREVNYKDGDFEWSLAPTYYKFSALVDPKDNNTKGDFSMAITPDTLGKDTVVVEYYAWGTSLTYTSTYRVTDLSQSTENGAVKITAKVSYVSSGGAIGEKKPANLDQIFSAYIGKLSENKFMADENNSLRGTVHVALKNDSSVEGAVDIVVGMEPFVLMDFEDHNGVGAEDYWSTHVGASSGGGSGQLLPDEVKNNRLWIRDTTGKGVIFPDGFNRIVSADEDENVRFGQYAFKLGYDFTKVNPTVVAAADFGFSGDLFVNAVQPTKIGMWIKVPASCAGDDSVLKAVLKGGAYEAALDTAYMKLNDDGSMSYIDGKQLTGTAAYVQYYSYNPDGTISGSKLSDWAGKDWIWVEADISAFQMPIDVCRAYTVRVTSPQNCTKSTGYLYIDNLQFIYGTNTNDITRPVLESVTETSSGTVLASDDSAVFGSGNLTFSVVYSDSELTDKYATGIDTSGIRVLLDGTDYTGSEKLEINNGSLYLKGVNLRNGTHTLTIRLKDFYGNVTTETRTFRVEDAQGKEAAIDIHPQPEKPVIGKDYLFAIVNRTGETIVSAQLTLDFSAMPGAADYLANATVKARGNYTIDLKVDKEKGLVTITINQIVMVTSLADAQSANDYVSELGYLIFTIPENTAAGSELKCAVAQGSYTVLDDSGNAEDCTFSGTEEVIPVTANYELSCGQSIVKMGTELIVIDANGTPISLAEIYMVNSDSTTTLLGDTDLRGKLTYTFEKAGEYTLYAVKKDGGRSWNQRLIVCEKTPENEGKPFGILTNGVKAPGTKSITWFIQIDGSADKALVRYSTKSDLSDAVTVEGTSKLKTFVQSSKGDALRNNKVTLIGLNPGTTYYYQVGDGTTWSDIYSFTTVDVNKKKTNFFILGDIQSSDTSNLGRVLSDLKESGTTYDFGIQTGDAIDNVTNYVSNWRPFLTTVNGNTLNGVDLIHVLGNHEYYGDANGEISADIYDLPESAQNSWYKLEYGLVCVVVVNNGTKLSETLADIAENLTTDCIWKVLVAHEPIYGTESVSATEEIISSIEKAGFDFVFGGDDHAYARTYPMIGGKAQDENSRDGVVYYVCGDLSSKNNAFNNQDCFVKAIPHNDYTGMYLTIEATEESFTVKAVKYDGIELDSYTEKRTDCELGNHKWDSTSKYDVAAGTITCTVCDKAFKPGSNFNYTGLLSTTDGKEVIFADGSLKRDAFSMIGETRYHSCSDGYIHKTTESDTRTCVTGGYIVYTCPECDAKDKSTDLLRPVGHDWDENHVCKKCEFKGIDINSEGIVFDFGTPESPRGKEDAPSYYYAVGGVRPASFAKYGDYVLTQNNDSNLINNKIPDLYREWPNSKNVGEATIKYEGRGDYYGTKELTYYIVPNNVTNLKCTASTQDSLTLSWTAALGAGYYEIFACSNEGNTSRKSLGYSDTTTFTVTGLDAYTEYYFVVAGRTKVAAENDKVYNSAKFSNILTARTDPEAVDVTGVSAKVDGQTIALEEVNGVKYLFLPASADLTKLSLTFKTDAEMGQVALSGGKGTIYWSESMDLTAVADVNANGYREVTAAVGKGKQTVVFRVMHASGLPTLYLTSADAENKGLAYVDASKNNVVVDAQMSLIAANGTRIYNGGLSQLKARGNSTFTYAEKKSYQIKLATATDLLGTQEQVKTWVLLASYFDATQMHDKLIKDLATSLGLAYTASCNWVNLYYDGEYRGVYLLSEKNSVGETSVAITDMEKAYAALNENYGTGMTTAMGKNSYGMDYQYTTGLKEPEKITGGYLIELNHDKWDEVSGFKTKQGVAFNVKSPEWCGNDAMKYISEYYQAFEDAVYAQDASGDYTGYNTATGKYFYDYVDMDSLVKLFLLQELGLNCDGFISSVYFYKDVDGKMYAGPIWDQDMTFGTGWNKTNSADIVDYHYLAKALIQIPAFKAAVEKYYTNSFAPAVRKWLGNNSAIAQHYNLLKDNAAMNYTLWSYIRVGNPEMTDHIWENTNYKAVVDDMTSWIEARLTKLDTLFKQQSALIGDVNGDGKVNSDDAVCILRYLVGFEVEGIQIENGDVNSDGKVNTDDAVRILRDLVGLD